MRLFQGLLTTSVQPLKNSQSIDIKALTSDDSALLELVKPAFEKYNEEQLTTAKLPGNGKIVSQHTLNSATIA